MPWLRFIPETTNIDFVGWRYYAFAVDGLLVLITVASIIFQGFNLGIDFTGGVLVEAKYTQTIDIKALRAKIAALNFGETEINSVGGTSGECAAPKDSCVEIRIQPPKDVSKEQTQSSEALMQNSILPKVKSVLAGYKIRDTNIIGPKVSEELFSAGVWATIAAILLISVYVAFRFEWQYGIGALIATGHDVFVTAGLFSVLKMDFTLNTVAALLLLAGYSINDTVIVFDRIRENRRKYKRMPLSQLINLSTNQIATRTTLVSAATAMSMLPLLFFGGPVLFNFSAAILFGILVGTFSSTYVAAALLLYLPAPAGAVEEPAESGVKA
jgi:preprotein translocase subunit SecF